MSADRVLPIASCISSLEIAFSLIHSLMNFERHWKKSLYFSFCLEPLSIIRSYTQSYRNISYQKFKRRHNLTENDVVICRKVRPKIRGCQIIYQQHSPASTGNNPQTRCANSSCSAHHSCSLTINCPWKCGQVTQDPPAPLLLNKDPGQKDSREN